MLLATRARHWRETQAPRASDSSLVTQTQPVPELRYAAGGDSTAHSKRHRRQLQFQVWAYLAFSAQEEAGEEPCSPLPPPPGKQRPSNTLSGPCDLWEGSTQPSPYFMSSTALVLQSIQKSQDQQHCSKKLRDLSLELQA